MEYSCLYNYILFKRSRAATKGRNVKILAQIQQNYAVTNSTKVTHVINFNKIRHHADLMWKSYKIAV